MADQETEKRLRCVEQLVAKLGVENIYIMDRLEAAMERIRELEDSQLIALAAYYKTHPEVIHDLDKVDAILGVGPDKKNPQS